MPAERVVAGQHTAYRFSTSQGEYLDWLTFREIMCLVAAEQGRVRAVWKRTYSPYFSDRWLTSTCDDHGIGYGTVSGLQQRWGRPQLIEACGTDEGPLGLTDEGRSALEQVRELVGGL